MYEGGPWPLPIRIPLHGLRIPCDFGNSPSPCQERHMRRFHDGFCGRPVVLGRSDDAGRLVRCQGSGFGSASQAIVLLIKNQGFSVLLCKASVVPYSGLLSPVGDSALFLTTRYRFHPISQTDQGDQTEVRLSAACDSASSSGKSASRT